MLDLDKVFSRKKSQKQVAEFLFRNGVRVTPDARFFLGEIEIAGAAENKPG
jgi:predicted regulator of amino acid metabolism with ACT domain